MTPALDTAEGRRLLEKATPGPWSVEYSEIGDGPDRRLIAFVMGSDETYVVVDEDPAGDDEPSPDARLIVYAVNNLAQLLTALDTQRAQIEALERERDELRAEADLREPRRIRLITVCDKCLTACCWHGIFMCDNAYGAGTVEKTARELRKLNLEHPSYYSAKEVARVCGDNIYREANR